VKKGHKSIEGTFHIAVHSKSVEKMLPSMYANTNTNTSTVNLQLREDHFAEKCVCEEQVQVFQPKLSPIKRSEAEDNVSEV
jgi:hypothetical protein